jgi:hypothetical protein
MIERLPVGVAELHLEKKRCGSPSPLPYFRIVPSKRGSAPIQGFFAQGEGINFTVGEATSREIFVNSKLEEKAEDEFSRICRSVFETRFSEKLIYSSQGKLLWSRIVLKVNGDEITLGGQKAFWWLYPKTRRQLHYEPYY